VISGRDRAECAAFRSYGTNLGLAFQLIDDALDYGGSSEELGKSTGDDFREGKITLPVVLCYRRGSDRDRSFWRRVLEKGEINEGDLSHAIELMRRHRAIDDTVERARHFGAVARDALAPFPESAHKMALLEAVDFCIARAY
jgi:octaprenyl-diphosphate synthase